MGKPGQLLQRAKRRKRIGGFRGLIKQSGLVFIRAVLRRLTPVKRNAYWNGVEVPEGVAPRYRLLDDYITSGRIDYEQSEGGEVESHKQFTEPGDHIIIIGGGRGVTAVRAAKECIYGQVIVYEANSTLSDLINEVVSLNGVEDVCEVRHALIGPDIAVRGDSWDDTTRIQPEDIPECDVLEMDCDGAEVEIIRNMTVRPRVIIVEVHPQLHPQAGEVLTKLSEYGYNIEQYRTNEGELLTKAEFVNVFDRCANGDEMAPVVAATRGDS